MSDDNEAELALAAVAADIIESIGLARAMEMNITGQAAASGVMAPPPRDPSGAWQPPPPGPQAGWQHTLRNPANRTHLLGSDPFMNQLYGRAHGPGREAVLSGPQQPQEASPEDQDGRREIPAEGLSPGQAEALHGGQGVDVVMQRPELPEAAPARPARSRSRRRRTRWR